MRHLIDPLDFSQEEITSLLVLADHIGADLAAYQDVAAHKKLAQWEREGKLKAVITQNIDGLHQKAGSREVLELHGSVLRNYCERCHKFYGLDAILHSTGVPKCTCGGDIKPDVVLYEEGLDEEVLSGAVSDYLEVFQDMSQSADRAWEQTM